MEDDFYIHFLKHLGATVGQALCWVLVVKREARHTPHLEAGADKETSNCTGGRGAASGLCTGAHEGLGAGKDAAPNLWTLGGPLGAGALS